MGMLIRKQPYMTSEVPSDEDGIEIPAARAVKNGVRVDLDSKAFLTSCIHSEPPKEVGRQPNFVMWVSRWTMQEVRRLESKSTLNPF